MFANGSVYAPLSVGANDGAHRRRHHGAHLAWSSVITFYFLKVRGFMDDNQPDN
jgi:hypothetical protein